MSPYRVSLPSESEKLYPEYEKGDGLSDERTFLRLESTGPGGVSGFVL